MIRISHFGMLLRESEGLVVDVVNRGLRLNNRTVSLPTAPSPASSFHGFALAVATGLFSSPPSALASEANTTTVNPSPPTSSTSCCGVLNRMISLGRCSTEPIVYEPANATLIRSVSATR